MKVEFRYSMKKTKKYSALSTTKHGRQSIAAQRSKTIAAFGNQLVAVYGGLILAAVITLVACQTPGPVTGRPDPNVSTSGTLGSVKATDRPASLPVPAADTVRKDSIR